MRVRSANASFFGVQVAVVTSPMYSLKESGLLLDALFAALVRGRDRARRKGRDGGEVCWQLARQALQKRHYVARFGVAQRHSELHPRHDADGLRKRRHRPVVKIGRGHRDIPQAGNTENIEVVRVLGDIGASVVDGLAARCHPIGLNDAKFSVHSAANEDSVVARYAAGIDEGIEASARFGRQCIDVTGEVAIKRRWCHQGPLIGPDGLGNVLARHWMRIVRESRFEQRGVTRNLFEAVDDRLLVRLPVRDRRGESLYHLILEAVPIAAPVNDEIEPGIEDCRGMARMRSLPDTDRLGQPVRSVARWLMTTGTTEIGVDRQSGIEEEQPPEIDSLRRNRRLRRRHVPRKRLKQSLSLLEALRFGLRCGCRRHDDQQCDAGEAEVYLHHLSPSAINPVTAPGFKLSRNLDPLRGDQMRWANLRSRSQRPRPTAATMASSTVPAQEAAT